MIEGHFIVIEGIDGAGTTTQTRCLAEGLRARGLPVLTTHEPSNGPVGVLLRQILTGRVVVPGIHGPRPSSWTTMALLFAADRCDHVEATIEPNLMDGVTVVSDRYDHSSVAYQSTAAGGDEASIRWVGEINRHARRPDLTIIIDTSEEVAAKRREARGGSRELYDDPEFQGRLVSFYQGIEQHFPADRVVHVDGERPEEEVAADVMQAVRELRNEA